MSSTEQFGFSTTTDDVLQGVDLTGKAMIVTGGASGIGLETSRSLAAAGASVTIAARRLREAEEIVGALRQSTANDAIEARALDLADLNSVRAFIDGWKGPLHALVNNAGIMALPVLERSPEGCEMQFATNFLGHFALTLGLHRHLAEAGDARVVCVSSTGSLFGPVLWGDPHFRFIPYDPLLAYAQSKTACILLSVGIAQRWAGSGITSNALHPGAIATNLQRYTGGLRTPEALRKTLRQGAATSVLLAASPALKGVSGRYFEDCNVAPVCNERPSAALAGVAPYALDGSNAERLWELALDLMTPQT